jgi:fibronectin type 3 domain-containing protein
MKRTYSFTLTLCLANLMICAVQTIAQTGAPATIPATVPNAQNGYGGIVIFTSDRIVAPSTPDPSGVVGWNIYRKSKNETAWRKLNAKPVQRSADKQDFEALYGATFLNDVVQLKEASSESEAWSRIQATTDREKAQVKSLFLDPRAVIPFGEAFVDSTAELGKEYEYAVAPLTASGEGVRQPRGLAVLQPAPELTVMMGAAATTIDPKNVELRWSCISRNGKVAGFEILRGDVAAGQPLRMKSLAFVLGNSGTMRYTDTDVQYGKAYRYLVLPFDALLNKERRTDTLDHIVALVRDLPLPQNLYATSTTAGIKLTWTLGKLPAPEYRGTIVLRSESSDMTRAREDSLYYPIDTLAYTQTEYIDRTATPGETYYYRLRTLGVDMSVSPLSTYYGTMFEMGRDKANIPPPVNLRGVSAKEGIRLTWSPLTIMPVEGYYVYRAMSARDSLELISKIIKDTVFVDSAKHLSPYSPYYYAVATVNSSFVWGGKSERIAVRHDTYAKPDAPSTPSAYQEHGAVVLQWSNESAMNPALAGYNVYRAAQGRTPQKLTAQPLAAATTQYRDLKPPADETLAYTITQIDAAGKESPPSPAAIVEYRLPDMRPPSSVRAIPSGKAVILRWSATNDLRVTGYEVIRALKDGTSTVVGRVAATVHEFADTTIKPGEAHYYTVVAVSAKGRSAKSAEVVVIP